MGGIFVLGIVLWMVPEAQVEQFKDIKPQVRASLEDQYRRTLAQIIGGLFLLVGLYLTWRRIAATERNVQIAQEGQITERFTRAIEHLGATHDDEQKTPRLEVRLGGIYALERIARDSKADHWPVMEVLTAYVRENAPWNEGSALTEDPQQRETPKPRVDVQAILTVLGRREHHYEKEGQILELSKTDLRRADLRQAHLKGANLWNARLERAFLAEAHLEGADLWEAHLEGANLRHANLENVHLAGAYLEGADLVGSRLERAHLQGSHLEDARLREAHLEKADLSAADLQNAYLQNAHLEGADLMGAHLERANLQGTHLEETDLRGAHLEGANVTQEQINTARGDEYTKLPEGLQTPEH